MKTLPLPTRFCLLNGLFLLAALTVGATPKVGVLIGDAVSPFGQVLARSFPAAGEKHGMSIVIKSPHIAENVAQSQRLLRSWENDPEIKGVIVACGIGGGELGKAVQPLVARGVPVIAFLGHLPPGLARATVLIDENTVIATAVNHCAKLIGPTDEVSLLRSNIRESQMNDRERLAIRGLRERYPELMIHADIFMNAEGRSPQAQAALLLEKYPGTKLVYSPYSTATMAMIAALRETGRAGKIHHVGIGAGIPPECASALLAGELDAWIALSPRDVAVKAVETLAAVLEGKNVPELVYSPVKVVTKDTLNSPEIMNELSLGLAKSP